jgi:dTDP-4-amino-4,6-dideoxygalactose transaminase
MSHYSNTSQKFIPFCIPTIEEEEIHEVIDTLKSGWITTGKKVLQFEEMLRSRLKAKNAIAVNSATSGWQLVAKAIGIGPGDEVIIPSITWPSISNGVELLGGRCVFADVDSESLQILPEEVSRLLTPRTKAVVPVHFAGAPFDIDAIKKIIEGKPIYLVEDAAHAAGTRYKGKEIGCSTQMAIFSFHAIKNMTTGEGGMIICNDDDLAEKLRLLRFHGITKDAWKRYSNGTSPEFEVINPGYKFNMMDLQAALGICQLNKLDSFNEKRKNLANRYNMHFADIEGIIPLSNREMPGNVHAWHLYIIKLDVEKLSIGRNEFIDALGKENIGAGLHFPAIHLMKYYREKYGYTKNDLPNATKAGSSILSLPIYPRMNMNDVDRVAETVQKVFKNNLKRKLHHENTYRRG